jgi:hypothetical protein
MELSFGLRMNRAGITRKCPRILIRRGKRTSGEREWRNLGGALHDGATVLFPCMPTRAAAGLNSGKSEAPKGHEKSLLARKTEKNEKTDSI